MHGQTKPHISPALAHLRFGVTACSLLVALCAALQMLVFGFVHFTEVRWVEARIEAEATPVKVVSGPGAAPGQIATAAQPTGPQVIALGQSAASGMSVARAISPGAGEAPVKPPRNFSAVNAVLQTVSEGAVSVGVIAALLLGLFTIMGMSIAGGACVPGVASATSAAMWSALLVLTCLPLQTVLPTLPFAGVFGSFTTMSDMSIAVDAGTGSEMLLGVYFLFLPLGAMGLSFLVLYRFRAGVAEGIIVTSVSELDDRLEREMAGIRSRGADAAPAIRAVAALNHAIGEAPVPVPVESSAAAEAPIPGDPIRKAPPQAAPRVGRDWTARERRMGQPDAGDPLKRPI